MQSHPTRPAHVPDISARVLAFSVFALGIALLCVVFGLAWSLFHAPVAGLVLPVPAGSAPQPAANMGAALAAFGRQVVLLALMTVAGSVIASKGIHLYFSAGAIAKSETTGT